MMCRELLELLQMEETVRFTRLVAGDESWLYLNHSHTHMSSVSNDERPVRVEQAMAIEKQIITVL
jgi:hypothetical protein